MAYNGRYSQNRDRALRGRETDETRSAVGIFLDNHIRLIVAVGTILLLLLCFFIVDRLWNGGTVYDGEGDGEGAELTIPYLHGLSEKTSALSWKDFEGFAYETMSDTSYETGIYVMRRYPVAGGEFSVTVAGFIKGEDYTGLVEYATVSYNRDFDFEFSLLRDDDFLSYLEEFGIKPE